MNEKYLIQNGINYNEGLKRCLGKKDLYEKILKAFVKDNILTKAKKAMHKKNLTELKFCIHEIKGSSANMSLTSVYLPANEINNLLVEKKYTEEELINAFDNFSKSYSTALMAIKKALSE